MNKVNLKRLIKRCMLYYLFAGIIIGLFMFIYSMNNINFTWNILDRPYHGRTAGMFALISMPPIISLVGIFHAIIIWYPIALIVEKMKIKLL